MRGKITAPTFSRRGFLLTFLTCFLFISITYGISGASNTDGGNEYLTVDCLLPGAVRKLGRQVTYLTPRRPVRTSERDCEIRGGEYVSYDRSDYKTALRVWLEEAKKGDPFAQTIVGEIYEKGLGVPPDYSEAARWYKKAAEKGNRRAEINLGHLYEKGLGVDRDSAKASVLYAKASDIPPALPVGDIPSAEPDKKVVAAPPAPTADIPAETAASDSAEKERMKREMALMREELEQTRRELVETQKELERRKSEAEASGRELENALRELENQKKKAESSRDTEEVERLQQRLDETNSALQSRQDEIKKLEAETERYRLKIASLDKQGDVAVNSGPVIEVIDPPMTPLTRGIAPMVKTKPGTERLIVGRIVAPAGLYTFTFNDREEKIDQNGMFQLRAPVKNERVPVKLVAIDKEGKRAAVEFMLAPDMENGSSDSEKPEKSSPALDFGEYYALVIGNTEYVYWQSLETPKNDALKVAGILKDKYGFKTQVLLNATRRDILQAMNEMRKKLAEGDNLLIYYAGHGYLDEKIGRGYWIPVDGEKDSPVQWISTSVIADFLGAMSAKHVLVVADSCYSGALTRTSIAQIEPGMSDKAREDLLLRISKARSRTVLSSGDLNPVLDGGGGAHSIFAKAFLEVLSQNENILEGQKLYASVSTKVARAADALNVEQAPQYAPIKFAGHESGDFLFVPKR